MKINSHFPSFFPSLRYKSNNNIISIEDRLRYYLGHAYDTKQVIHLEDKKQSWWSLLMNESSSRDFLTKPGLSLYLDDICSYIKLLKAHESYTFLLLAGDVRWNTSSYVITKTRPVESTGNVLLNLKRKRHWGTIPKVNKWDIPFELKKSKILWRGNLNGGESRMPLIGMYQNSSKYIDVGFTDFMPYKKLEGARFEKVGKMSLNQMLQYKYLISLEGNDIASNLKWIMSSNSLVFMPKPKRCSWFMEDKLIPWVHYIPIADDLSNLEELLHWCENNQETCEQIIQNEKEYVNQFLDESSELAITKKVLEIYCKNISYDISNFAGKDSITLEALEGKKNIISTTQRS